MTRFVALAGLSALLLGPLAGAQPGGRVPPDLAEASRLIVEQANAFRRLHGARPTTPNDALAEAARGFAHYMARNDRYGHEADGRRPADRARAQGYDYCLVSENIGYVFHSAGFRTPDLARRVVQGWENSPSHRQNMLDADATETGVAIAQSPKTGRYYAVQMFGRPQALRIEFRIANRSSTPVRYEIAGEWFQLPPRVTRTHAQCRIETLTMRLPGAAEPTSIQPTDGERYAVEQVGSRLRLTKG